MLNFSKSSNNQNDIKQLMDTYYSCGKLLLTSEYLVLRGAVAFALPTKKGQRLNVMPILGHEIKWTSKDSDGNIWFSALLDLDELRCLSASDEVMGNRISSLLTEARKLNPEFLDEAFEVETVLEFPRDWGLGSSSTLVNNVAQWADIDTHVLLESTFGGSGYDVAVAKAARPILYQLKNGRPIIKEIDFSPSYSDKLFFIHLGRKQDSSEEVTRFEELEISTDDIERSSALTQSMLAAENLEDFEDVVIEHDVFMAELLGKTSAQSTFPDYHDAVKFLGAWGGDFMLATGFEDQMEYFRSKGYTTIVPYSEMILS